MPYNPAIHHRRSIRLKDYDYSQSGIYFVTICCDQWICRFGKIENGEMILNKYGQIAYNEWMKTPDKRSNVQLDVFVIMPNHIHGIIVITDDYSRGVLHTPHNICSRGVLHTPHNICSRGVLQTPQNEPNRSNSVGVCNTPLRSSSNTVGAIVRGYKSAVTKQIGFAIWQRNYYEHIIRNEQSYRHISDYVMNNPTKWKDDQFYME